MATRKPIEAGDFVKIANQKIGRYQAVFAGTLKIETGYEVVDIIEARPRRYNLTVPRHPEPVQVYAKDCKLFARKDKSAA